MSRTAEALLEFTRLKEIVGGHSTCAPGHRAVEALAPQQDVGALNAEFELIREAIVCLRGGLELGFGALADPDGWLAKLAVPASVLAPDEFLDVASLAESANAAKQTLKPEAVKYPRLADLAAATADFRSLLAAIQQRLARDDIDAILRSAFNAPTQPRTRWIGACSRPGYRRLSRPTIANPPPSSSTEAGN